LFEGRTKCKEGEIRGKEREREKHNAKGETE